MYIVSGCLLGINCKYNGGNNKSEKVISFLEGKEYVVVCPESCGKLPTPRIPAERIGDLVLNKEGKDVTKEFFDGAKLSYDFALKVALEKDEEIEGAILKFGSPSCGKGKIYDGTFSNQLVDGNGVFADILLEQGIKVITEKEL